MSVVIFIIFLFHIFSSYVLIYIFSEAFVLFFFWSIFSEAFVLFFLEPGVSLEATSLFLGIEVRLAYILSSPNSINSFAISGIILGIVVVYPKYGK
ncbi:hypothetical protein Hanom_Chr08g00700471 [Helianthus anomalus]